MPRPAAPRRRPATRLELLRRSALCGVLASGVAVPALAANTVLPVQAATTPQTSGTGGQYQPVISVTGTSTAATMKVVTNDPRTIIDWNSFTVGAGNTVNFTFNAKSDIVLNRMLDSTPVDIEGTLTSNLTSGGVGGNVWFSAPGGVVFGSTAIVNVGGLMATTGVLSGDQVTQFLNPAVDTFSFAYPATYPAATGYAGGTYYPAGLTYGPGSSYPAINGAPTSNVSGGVGGVSVQSGAQLNTQGGLLALIAPFVDVAAGATVTANDQTGAGGGAGSVLYGSANAYSLTLQQESSGDLDMLQFVIDTPSDVSGYPMLLGGTTQGTNVFALSVESVAGAVIEARGAVTATRASTGQGGEIILSSNADTVNAPSYSTSSSPNFTPGSAVNTSGSTYPTMNIQVGDVTAGSDLQIVSSGAIQVVAQSDQLMSGADMTLTAAGDIDLQTVTAGGAFTANAVQSYVGLGVVQAASITAGGPVTLAGLNMVVPSITVAQSAGANGTVTADAYDGQTPSSNAFINIGSITAPGNVNLTGHDGYVQLTNMNFTGSGQALNLNAYGNVGEIYLGYGSGSGQAVPGVGSITGTGAIDLYAADVAYVNVAGDVTIANAQGADVYVTATGLAHVNNATTSSLVTDPIDVKGATAYLGTANSQDDINVTATNGSATVGDVNAAGSVTVSATNGSASLHSAALGSTANGGTGYPGGTSYPNIVTLSASGTAADAILGETTGGVLDGSGFVTGASAINISAGRDATVDVDQAIELASLSAGRNLSLTAPSLTLDGAPTGALAGNILIDVTADNFTDADPLTAGGAITVEASGSLTLANLTADGGGVALTGAGITAGVLQAAGQISALATANGTFGTVGTGPVSLTSASTTSGGVDVEGSSVTVSGALTASGAGGTVIATAYDVQNAAQSGQAFVDVGSISATGDITVTGNDGYASIGSVTFTGTGQTLTLTAYSDPAYLGYGPGGPGANGGEGPTPSQGSVTGAGIIDIYSAADADVALNGAADLDFVSADGTVNITAGSVTVGTAAGLMGVNVTASTGDLDVTALNVNNGQLGLSSPEGDVHADATLGNATIALATAQDIYVTAAQTAHVGAATTNSPYIDPIEVTGATAYLGTANSQDDINVTATNGSATVGDVNAAGSVTVSATNGTASLHSASLGAAANNGTGYPGGSSYPNIVTLSATNGDALLGGADSNNAIGFVVGASAINVSADHDVSVDVSQPIELTSVSAGVDLSLIAPSLTLDSAPGGALAGDILIDVTDDNFTYTNAIAAGGALTVEASGALTLGALTANGGDLSVTGASVNAGALQASGHVGATSTAGDITLTGAITAGTGVDVDSAPTGATQPGSVDIGDVAANGGNAYIAGTSVTAGQVTAQDLISVTASSGDIDLAGAQAGTTLNLSAAQGAVYASNPLSAPGGVFLLALYDIGIGQATSTAGNVTLLSGGSVSATTLSAGPGAYVEVAAGLEPAAGGDSESYASASLGSVSAGGDIYVTAPGEIQIGSLNAGATDANAVDVAGLDISPLDGSAPYATPAPTSIRLGSATSAGGVNLNASSFIQATTLTGAGPITAYTSATATDDETNYDVDIGTATSTGGGNITLAAAQGYASLGSASLTGAGVLSISAPNGAVYLGYQPGGQMQGGGGALSMAAPGELSAAGGVYVDVTGSALFDQVVAGGDADLTANALSVTSVQGATVTLTATTGDLDVASADALGGPAALVSEAGAVNVSGYVSGEGVSVNAATTADVYGTTTSEPAGTGYDPSSSIKVEGAQATLGDATAFGDVVLSATNGDASGGSLYGGTVTVSATNGVASLLNAAVVQDGASERQPPGTLTMTATGADGDVLLGTNSLTGAGGMVGPFSGVTLDASRDVSVDVVEPITLTSVSAGRNLTVIAPSLTLAASPGGTLSGNILIDVTDGDFSDAHALDAGGAVTVDATGALALGDVTASGGGVTLSGASVGAGVVQAGGAVLVSALDGDLDLQGATAGGFVALAAQGSIVTGDLAANGGWIDLRAGLADASDPTANPAGAVQTGDLTALDYVNIISAPAGVTTGAITVSPSFQTGGYVHIEGDTTGPVEDPTGTAGAYTAAEPTFIATGAISAPADIALSSAGPITASSASAGTDLVVDAGGALSIGGVSAGRNLSLTAPSVSLGALTDQPSGSLFVDATAGPFTDDNPLSAAGGVTVEAAGTLSLGPVDSSGGAIALTGSSVGAGALDAGAGVTVSARAGDATLGAVTAGGDVAVTAPAGSVSLASLDAGGAAVLTLGGPTLSAGPVTVGGDFTATGIGAQGDATVGLSSLVFTAVRAGGAIDVEGGSVFARSLTGGGTITAIAYPDGQTDGYAGDVDIGAATAPGAILLRSGDGYVSLGSVDLVGADASLTEQGAAFVDLGYQQGQAPGQLPSNPGSGTVTGAGPITLISSGAVNAAVQGDLSLADVEAGGQATISGATVAIAGLDVGGGLSVTGTSIALPASAVQVGGDATLTASSGAIAGSGPIDAGGSVDVAAPSIQLGDVSAGAQATLDATAGALQVGAVTASGGAATLTGMGVSAGAVSAEGGVTVAGGTGAVGVASISTPDEANLNGGAVSLGGGKVGGALAIAGTDITLAGAIGVGGDATLTATNGAITGPAALNAGGSVDVAAPSIQLGDISAGAQATLDATAGALQVGAVTAIGGAATLTGTGVSAGAVSAEDGVTVAGGTGAVGVASISTPQGATLTGAVVSLGGGTIGGDLAATSSGDVTLGAVTGGGALTLDAGGLASIGSVAFAGASRVTAGTLDVATLLAAPTLTIEARNGALTVGGTTAPGGGGMWISAADFSRLRASTALDLYAGAAETTARGGLEISNLSLDPTMTPVVNFYAAGGQTVSVDGAVTPTRSGGVLTIGSATDAAWTPSTILVSGALGAATRANDTAFTGVTAFSQVALNSAGDILIGSPRFFALIQATPADDIDVALDKPGGVTATGAEIGKVYIVAGQLSVSAPGKVVQQNTSGRAGQYAGLYLVNGATPSHNALTIDPPSVVDLFGSYVDASGQLQSGTGASRGSGLVVLGLAEGEPTPSDYRFNGCVISPDAACGIDIGSVQGLEPLQEAQAAAIAAQTTSPNQLTQSVLLTISPALQVEEDVDPLITGVGNEEIWRKRNGDDDQGDDQ